MDLVQEVNLKDEYRIYTMGDVTKGLIPWLILAFILGMISMAAFLIVAVLTGVFG